MRTSELAVLVLVEAEDDFAAPDQNRATDQVRVLDHEVDRFLLGLRQRPLFPDRASRADEVEKAGRVDVLFEELPRGWFLVDVNLVNVNAGCVQKTSGILAGRSCRLRVESRFSHNGRIIEVGIWNLEFGIRTFEV
jgi:hypothetical protein